MEKKYYAFISYSRKDSKAAAYLHKHLEHFRVPIKYVAEENRPPGKKFLRPVFRDRRDLEVGEGSFTSHIQTAIEESRYLIVLCSPKSAASIWVNEEIKHFLAAHDNDYNSIVPVILNGEPGIGGDAECLPEALQSEEITMRNLPSMIPDVGDDEKTGWENGVVQAMSYMLKVNREKIKATIDAEKVRQVKIYAIIGVAVTIVFALLTRWAIRAEHQATANEQRATLIEDTLENVYDTTANQLYISWVLAENEELRRAVERHTLFNLFGPDAQPVSLFNDSEVQPIKKAQKESNEELHSAGSLANDGTIDRRHNNRTEICNPSQRRRISSVLSLVRENLSALERESQTPEKMRKIYIDLFFHEILDSLKQYFHHASQCKKSEDKEQCYTEIHKFLSALTPEEISRYKELQAIQKRLDGIYNKNTK